MAEGAAGDAAAVGSAGRPMARRSERRLQALLAVLRLLQRVVKYAPQRVRSLVSYKTPVILRKALALPSAPVQYYALKLYKCMGRLLGRKWKAANTHVLTGIFMRLPPKLEPDFLSSEAQTPGAPLPLPRSRPAVRGVLGVMARRPGRGCGGIGPAPSRSNRLLQPDLLRRRHTLQRRRRRRRVAIGALRGDGSRRNAARGTQAGGARARRELPSGSRNLASRDVAPRALSELPSAFA